MTGRARLLEAALPAGAVSGTRSVELTEGWQLAQAEPASPRSDLDAALLAWREAVVPGTVAQSTGSANLDGHPDYDASDWWYRCTFSDPRTASDDHVRLRFDGLATLAEVWLNGQLVLESSNMFCPAQVDVSDLVSEDNTLRIVFRSLGAALAERRPRPRWKTRLVDQQQLRWFRTTLLGRIPGWTPAIPPVGPWRQVWLETGRVVDVTSMDLGTDVVDGTATISLEATVECAPGVSLESASLHVGGQQLEVDVAEANGSWSARCDAEVGELAPWWPRTHGVPALHECALELVTSAGPVSVDCGRVGFRSLHVDRTDGRLQFVVNGIPIFCRGACWTTNDIVSLVGSSERMHRTLELLGRANGNMVRVGGTMVYETDEFYRRCDELGIMVWQDFMFANMDYPVEDEDFSRSIHEEAAHQIRRLRRHPSVVAFCGGSEVEQQAAMFGAPREIWSNDFFSESLPRLVDRHAPGIPYWPSTPTEGDLPFHVGTGVAHYYAVGAYKKPLEDARLSPVKFTTECLGFSNVPDPAPPGRGAGGGISAPPHHPEWKAGVPRDSGAGWDFEDIRDHYLGRIFGVDPVELRSQDLDSYLRLSRVVTGRVMARVFDEWRSPEHPCAGGLVWFLQDLRPGAGWGIIDAGNAPKAAYWYLRRAWRPLSTTLLDRGVDGLQLEIHNETDRDVHADVEIRCYDAHSVVTARGSTSFDVPRRDSALANVEAVLGHFADPTYSYFFGPRRHHAVGALVSFDGAPRSLEALFWVAPGAGIPATDITAEIEDAPGGARVSLSASALTLEARVEQPGMDAEDDYFDLVPDVERVVTLREANASTKQRRGYVDARNAADHVRLPKLSPGGA